MKLYMTFFIKSLGLEGFKFRNEPLMNWVSTIPALIEYFFLKKSAIKSRLQKWLNDYFF